MMARRIVIHASLLASLATAACSDAQPKPPAAAGPKPPAASAPASGGQPAAQSGGGAGAPQAKGAAPSWPLSSATSDAAVIEVGGLSFPKPATWQWQLPTMQFRTLQYSVPGPGGEDGGAAELVISLFAGGDGGPIDANIERWVRQFRASDGGPITPIREDITVAGMKVALIELKGSYQGMGAAAPRPGQMQFGAIVQAPDRNVFLRLNGPERTVELQRKDFRAMIDGLRADLAAPPAP
jgi:hypothetical protein